MLFSNVSRDTAYAYLSEGLSSEIATTLARVPRLEVRSPGAVRSAQRGVEPDPRVIGRRLNVRYVVEGDFQRGGDRIRISVRLVGVPSGTQRWSESYTRPAADLLAVQEEIARAVATAIAGQLLPQERTVLTVRPTRDAEAYDHLLRANSQLAQRTPGGVQRAMDEYAEAVRLDPTFVKAQARIGLCHALILVWGWETPGVSRDSQLTAGFSAVDRALAVDSSSADAWTARGYLLAHRYPQTLDGVIPSLQRAVELEPTNAESWHQYGIWLSIYGRTHDGIAAMERAIALEPGRAATLDNLGHWVYQIAGRMAEAHRALDSAVAAVPVMPAPYTHRSFERLRSGDLAGARRDADMAMRLSPPHEEYFGLAPLAWLAAASGDSVLARQLAGRAVQVVANRPLSPVVADIVALGLLGVGDRDGALAMLERTTPRGALLGLTLRTPALATLAADPRFQRLLDETRPPGAR